MDENVKSSHPKKRFTGFKNSKHSSTNALSSTAIKKSFQIPEEILQDPTLNSLIAQVSLFHHSILYLIRSHPIIILKFINPFGKFKKINQMWLLYNFQRGF